LALAVPIIFFFFSVVCSFFGPVAWFGLWTGLVQIIFKNSVRTSKRTPHFTITKINWLMLFKFNPLKTKLVQIIFNNSVRTSKRTPHFTITKIKWLTLFKEIIAVYTENHTKRTNTKYRFTDSFRTQMSGGALLHEQINVADSDFLSTLVCNPKTPDALPT
jgi:hypothetical protein